MGKNCSHSGLSSGVKKGLVTSYYLYPLFRVKEDDIPYICEIVILGTLKLLLTLSFKVSISHDDLIIMGNDDHPTQKNSSLDEYINQDRSMFTS